MDVIPFMTQRSPGRRRTSSSHIDVWVLCVVARQRHPFERGPQSGQDLLDTLRALPALSTHVCEMSVQQFVDRRAPRRRLDVGQTDSQFGELADLELDRFGLDRGFGRGPFAVGRLVPPDAPAQELIVPYEPESTGT